MKIELEDEIGQILTLSTKDNVVIDLRVEADGTVNLNSAKFKVKSISG